MNIWITTDTHFNHAKVIEYCNRPADHEVRLERSLKGIPAGDLLIHLGDICIGNDEVVHEK